MLNTSMNSGTLLMRSAANTTTTRSAISDPQKLIALLKLSNRTSEISQIHACIVKTGLDHVPFVLSKLIASSIRDIEYAASIFNHIHDPNLFMFNSMLRGYSISDYPKQAFAVFNQLRAKSIVLDEFSFVATLKACARDSALGTGIGIHSVVLRSGFHLFINVKNVLLHLYSVCKRIEDAQNVFDELPERNDLISWNTLMGGYLSMSQPVLVAQLLTQMGRKGLEFSVNTILIALSAAGDLLNFLGGQALHGYCIKKYFSFEISVVTSLIDMYATCGHIEIGRIIFDEAAEKDVVLWNCLVDKYAKCGMVEKALDLVYQMKLASKKPNSSTLAGLLSACADSGAVNIGRCINDYIEEDGLALDAVLGTALVYMYSKCGFLKKAINIFDRIENKDVKSWTTMITGYWVHGQMREAIQSLHKMEDEGFKPNEITFLVALSACSHGGLVAEGMRCFEKMVYMYGLMPKIEHYGSIIDLLGRGGLLEEAYKLIKCLPFKSDATTWRALLASCRVHGNVALGESVKKELVDLNDEHPTNLMLLSSTYAIAGRLSDFTGMQEVKKENHGSEQVKEVGYSIVEMDSWNLIDI